MPTNFNLYCDESRYLRSERQPSGHWCLFRPTKGQAENRLERVSAVQIDLNDALTDMLPTVEALTFYGLQPLVQHSISSTRH
jgi:hypothetical protein